MLFALLVISVGAIAITGIKLGSIVGKVAPANGAESVVLISEKDTLRTEINQGMFVFNNLKQGVYTVWVKGAAPYKDAILEKVAVKDSSTTDLGTIQLPQ